MFRIKYNDRGVNKVEDNIQDIRTLYDILIGILNDEKKEEVIGQWCSNAHWGDSITLYGITVDCYRESDTKNSAIDKNAVITKISNTVNLPIKFNKTIGHVEVWNIGLGISFIAYDNISNNWKLEIRRSDEQLAWHIIAETSANIFMPKAIRALIEIKNKYKFEQHEVLQKIADKITERTGVKNEFIGEDNGSLTWDFDFGVSYMKNNGGKGLYFACNDSKGREIFDLLDCSAKTFIDIVSNNLIQLDKVDKAKRNRVLRNEEIIKLLSSKNKCSLRVYEDNCWWLDIEKLSNGLIRIWVGFEDKRSGKSRGSIVSINNTNGNIRYSTDGIVLKKAVEKKMLSLVQSLIRNGILR